MINETDLYLPMLQPLQFAKGWKTRHKGFIAISDLENCLHKDCLGRPGKFDDFILSIIFFNMIQLILFNNLMSDLQLIFVLDLLTDKALKKIKPDRTFYLSYDLNRVPNDQYHHEKFYPYETMELIDRETNIAQFNHITSEVNI